MGVAFSPNKTQGSTHPAGSGAPSWPRAVHQNAPGAAIARRARGCPGLALLCVLQRLKANRPLGHARQAQAAISLIAKSTRTAALRGNAPGWIRRTARPGAGHQHAQQHQDSRQQHSPGQQRGPSSPATPGCAQPWPAAPGSALSWIRRTVARTRPRAGQRHAQHAPGQGLATRTRQARSSLAGQGVALGWWVFACWGA
jgi:hypothetical protein